MPNDIFDRLTVLHLLSFRSGAHKAEGPLKGQVAYRYIVGQDFRTNPHEI